MGSASLHRFLSLMGSRVPLNGWNSYAGGLDTIRGTTGVESVYTLFHGFEIMFHVRRFIK